MLKTAEDRVQWTPCTPLHPLPFSYYAISFRGSQELLFLFEKELPIYLHNTRSCHTFVA